MNSTLSMQIRNFEKGDLDKIIEIAKELQQWFNQTGIEHMSIDLKYQSGFVALRNSEIVGFVSFYVSEGQGQLAWIGVKPDLHQQGVGRLLVDHLVKMLKENGVSKLNVNTLGDSVDYEPYNKTRRFYRSLGFKTSQTIQQDNPEWPELLVMTKQL